MMPVGRAAVLVRAAVVASAVVGCAASTASTAPAMASHDDGTLAGFERVDGVCPETVCFGEGLGGERDGVTWRYTGSVPVSLYRVYGSAGRQLASWWSFERPHGTPDDFRARFGVCPEFNDLAHATVCPLRPGAVVIVGPGQTVDCQNGVQYDTSPTLQVFVNDPATAFDEQACQPVSWPH